MGAFSATPFGTVALAGGRAVLAPAGSEAIDRTLSRARAASEFRYSSLDTTWLLPRLKAIFLAFLTGAVTGSTSVSASLFSNSMDSEGGLSSGCAAGSTMSLIVFVKRLLI